MFLKTLLFFLVAGILNVFEKDPLLLSKSLTSLIEYVIAKGKFLNS